MTTYSSALGTSSANCKLMVMMSNPPTPTSFHSVGNGLRLGVKRWAHILHPEPGLQHLTTRDHLPRGPPGLRKAKPSLRVCGDGNRWRNRASLGHRHGSREDGKHQRRGPWIFTARVSTTVTRPSALLAFFCHCCVQKWDQIYEWVYNNFYIRKKNLHCRCSKKSPSFGFDFIKAFFLADKIVASQIHMSLHHILQTCLSLGCSPQ